MSNVNNVTVIAESADAALRIGLNEVVVAAPDDVVFHDAVGVMIAEEIKQRSPQAEIDALVFERQAWEDNALRTSNEQLYLLLQKCYALYKRMCSDASDAKKLVATVDTFLSERYNAKSTKNSHTLTKIVKCVFGPDRKRASTYSIALRAALAANIAVTDIPGYIRGRGGVEELRLAKSPNAKTTKQRAEVAEKIVDTHVIGHFKLENLSEHWDAAKVGAQHVLIVTQRADGEFDVNALISSSSAVNAALASFYSQNKATAADEIVEKQIRQDNELNDAIKSAAQSVFQ